MGCRTPVREVMSEVGEARCVGPAGGNWVGWVAPVLLPRCISLSLRPHLEERVMEPPTSL